jgi:hypothetical protein
VSRPHPQALASGRARRIEVDLLDDVTFLDSSAISVLCLAEQKVSANATFVRGRPTHGPRSRAGGGRVAHLATTAKLAPSQRPTLIGETDVLPAVEPS